MEKKIVKNFIILGVPLKLLVVKLMGWRGDGRSMRHAQANEYFTPNILLGSLKGRNRVLDLPSLLGRDPVLPRKCLFFGGTC